MSVLLLLVELFVGLFMLYLFNVKSKLKIQLF